jgi:hypothetical protein
MRQEGAECRQGFSFMIKPHLQVILFLGFYKTRHKLMLGYSYKSKRIYKDYEKWTMDDDIQSHIFMYGYMTHEQAMDKATNLLAKG